MADPSQANRRPIPQRGAAWAIRLTRRLGGMGVRPNHISVLGLGFAAFSAICLILSGSVSEGARGVLLVAAAAGIPLRLLCNMIDGMLAVEEGLQEPTGPLYNELPDRLADVLVLAAAGYAATGYAWGSDLGWIAAVSALLTAYVRTLGAAAGAGEHFEGPMAKPRRMHVMIAACLLSLAEPIFGWPRGALLALGLLLVLLGDVATIVVRLRLIAADLWRQ
jgi:phosphatidylglycerophosphate synthase